ncbi:toxin VasX [Aquimarina longa]|uniref:toxin VasX n=1 Tax=Aquimarina longa TaxID=1080221 RepID=UPI0007854639|nr:toxin VasX [Aquimarina longa]
MADELTLQQRQRQAYNEVVGRYIFEVEYPGAPIVQSRELTVTKAGIKLYFLRHGAFDEYSMRPAIEIDVEDPKPIKKPIRITSNGVIELEEVTVIQYGDRPDIENCFYGETFLREGYIYLLFENRDDLWLEYQTVRGGGLKPIIWEQGSTIAGNDGFYDVRQPDNTIIDSGISVAQCDVVWVAFSDVQWSVAYHQKMRSDTSARAARMQRIECTGLQPNEEIPGVKSYDQVDAVCTAEQQTEARWIHHRLEQVQLEDTDPELKEDMFIILEDPVGIVSDLHHILANKVLEHKAMVDAVRSGETHQQAINRLEKGDIIPPVPEPAYQHLFSLALSCYQMVYNSPKTIQKYDGGGKGIDLLQVHPGDTTINRRITKTGTVTTYSNTQLALGYGLNREKLIEILGVNKRRELRDTVLTYRTALGNLLQDPYLSPYLEDYLHNTSEHRLWGRADFLTYLEHIVSTPHTYERHLLLHNELVRTDQWSKWTWQLLDPNNPPEKPPALPTAAPEYTGLDPLYALVGTSLNLTEVYHKGDKTSIKLAKLIKKIIKPLAEQAYTSKMHNGKFYQEIAEKHTFMVNRLNQYIKVFDEELVVMSNTQIQLRLRELGVVLDPEYVQTTTYLHKEEQILALLRGSKGVTVDEGRVGYFPDQQTKVAISTAREINPETHSRNLRNQKIEKLIKSRAFNGVFALLEIYNFKNAFFKVIDKERKFKEEANLLGSSVKLTEAMLNLRIAFIEHSGKEATRTFGLRASMVGAIGSVFTSGMCFWEAIESHTQRDSDAGMAFIGAGIAFGISAGVSITAVATSAVAIGYTGAVASSITAWGTALGLTGPVGWIAALIGVGILVLAQLYKDTALETYFKHFLLSDYKEFTALPNELPMEYTRRLIAARDTLVDQPQDNQHLIDPYLASATLMDLVVCTKVSIRIKGDPKKRIPLLVTSTSDIYESSTIYLTMRYHHYFNHTDQVHYHAFLYPDGIADSSPITLPTKAVITEVVDDQLQKAVQIALRLSSTYQRLCAENACMLVATRLEVDSDTGHYFPFRIATTERWLGTIVHLSPHNYMVKEQEEFIIGSLDLLKKAATWQ